MMKNILAITMMALLTACVAPEGKSCCCKEQCAKMGTVDGKEKKCCCMKDGKKVQCPMHGKKDASK